MNALQTYIQKQNALSKKKAKCNVMKKKLKEENTVSQAFIL